jgi:large subunit ribosomal protein L31
MPEGARAFSCGLPDLAESTLGPPVHGRATWPTRRNPDPRRTMKKNIHPEYVETTVTCSCGETFTTRSTAPNGVIHADVCSKCHPFYTGKQKILDTGGRVARFQERYGQKAGK